MSIVYKNAAMALHASEAANQLSGVAGELQAAVARFRLEEQTPTWPHGQEEAAHLAASRSPAFAALPDLSAQSAG